MNSTVIAGMLKGTVKEAEALETDDIIHNSKITIVNTDQIICDTNFDGGGAIKRGT